MTDASLKLQAAMVAALKADAALAAILAGTGIYDLAPPSASFPYITIGRCEVADWSTGTEEGGEHLVSLHIWSQGAGKAESLRVMREASRALEGIDPVLDGHFIVSFRLEYSEAGYDEDARLHHGLLRYRALVEKTG
ncbi:MAG: DUF3168 domain-containing protein [Notoacmeibacter sp.]|nr:DUF3168 domain-containing protein [Notoacmeibacter sp.]